MMLLCDPSMFITIADSAPPTAVRARITLTLLHRSRWSGGHRSAQTRMIRRN